MKKLSFFILIVFALFSCREDMDVIDPPIGPAPKIIVNASVYGQVTNESGMALADASVFFDNEMTTTDEHGVFSFNNSKLYQDGTFVRVSKDGYMMGSRMFYPDVNQDSHIKVQLIAKQLRGTVVSQQGGKVEFQGATIDLPAYGFVSTDGSDYSGNVNIMAKYLDPSSEATFLEMPGDLVGINSESDQMALATYGMLGVELEDDNGNQLQIKDGFTAAISVPLPSSHLGTAPATIPLWHFDNESGYWIEEGSATLINGKYEGEVSHFSFWNCDAPFPLIELSGIIKLKNAPYEGIKVEIVDTDSGFSGCGLTSDLGYFGGKVPKDKNLTINVYDECGTIIYTDNIGTFSDDTFLPTINITTLLSTINVSGSLNNCNGDLIDDGYLLVSYGLGSSLTFPIEDDQTFDITLANCNDQQGHIIGVDQTNQQTSAPILIDLTNDLDLGSIETCFDYYEPKINIEYFGSPFEQPDVLLQGTYNEIIFNDANPPKSLFNVTIIDWNGGFAGVDFSFVLEHGAISTDYTIDFEQSGFSCSGTATVIITIDPTSGDRLLIFKSTSTDINVTDSSIFDNNITEVIIDLGI